MTASQRRVRDNAHEIDITEDVANEAWRHNDTLGHRVGLGRAGRASGKINWFQKANPHQARPNGLDLLSEPAGPGPALPVI